MMKFKNIPSVNDLLISAPFQPMIHQYGRTIIKNILRSTLDDLRLKIEELTLQEVEDVHLANAVMKKLTSLLQSQIIRVINATGTVLHTNLGRAPLAPAALAAVIDVSSGYSNLEYNLQTGKRGKRTDHINDALIRLTGAEAALAVNNNAGAVMLTLAAMARGREVIISRGELVEIGGGFRIPEVMATSGAILKEVGTTNRTHHRDYSEAISENTGLIMKAHRSNFGIVGFTADVEIDDLISLGKSQNIPVMYDLGSGCFFDGASHGWHATLVPDLLQKNIDIVTFSGDKLLGGPQAGIIAGKKTFINQIASHPMARALRLDKMTLAALDMTLRLYLQPEIAREQIPVLNVLTRDINALKHQAERVAERLKQSLPDHYTVTVMTDKATPGGGSLPMTLLDTWVTTLTSSKLSSQEIATLLRKTPTPVISRVNQESVLLDMRTIRTEEESDLIRQVLSALSL